MRKQICVTEKDIINGNKRPYYNIENRGKLCPIAQSLKRNKIKFKYVERKKIDFGHNKKVDLPLKAQEFIKIVDYEEVVKSFRFTIDVPKENLLEIKNRTN